MKSIFSPIVRCALLLCILYVITYFVIHLSWVTEFVAVSELIDIKTTILLFMIPIFFKYLVQLFSLPFYPVIEKLRSFNSENKTFKKVSVLIPAWNEEIGIIKTLNSVINTGYRDLEIIIINDGSTDATHQLISDFIRIYEPKDNKHKTAVLKYISLPNNGKAVALNHGLKIASGDYIITLDADSVMDTNMISNMVKRFSDEQVAAVAGNVIIGNRKKPIELLQQLEYLHGFCFKRADSNFNSVHIIGGAAAAYKKSALVAVGGFDEKIITEDVEISTRLLAAGYKTRYASNAVVYTEGPTDWKSLASQRLRWKFGRIQTYVKHSSLFLNPSSKFNLYLTFLVLPIALYVELLLLLEPIILTLFYAYTFYTNDFAPLLFMIAFTSSIILLQILFDPKLRFHLNLVILAPIAWLLFYAVDLVEFQALCRSGIRFIKKENLKWQTWARVGIISQTVARNVNYSNTSLMEGEIQ
ncbi:MAG: glycosyltransferase [Kangiellaceae bacterium]